MHIAPRHVHAWPVLLALVTSVIACAGGARHTARATAPTEAEASCAGSPTNGRMQPLTLAYVLDGRLLARDVRSPAVGAPPGAPPEPEQPPEVARLGVDDIFNMEFISDTAAVASYGLCPGTTAVVITTVAEARRQGLRPPPPALCIRPLPVGYSEDLVLPIGAAFRVGAGQLDILHECDRPAPPEVHWASSNPDVVEVDSTGLARGRARGRAELVASAEGVEARLTVTVVPPVTRIVITPADTVLAVGDTVLFRASAIGANGQPIPEALLSLRVHEDRTSNASGSSPLFLPVWPFGSQPRRPEPNTLRVRALRTGGGYIVAAMVGRVDSVRVEAVAP